MYSVDWLLCLQLRDKAKYSENLLHVAFPFLVLRFDLILECRSTIKALAAVSRFLPQHQASVACIDMLADSDLAHAFHVQQSPAVKLLFQSGEMFEINMKPLKTAKHLLQFLLKQVQPAFETVDSLESAEKVRPASVVFFSRNIG